MLEKTRSRPKHRIEKHLLGIPEERRIVDTAYRQSFKERVCEASDNGIDLCGLPCVGAHVRAGEYPWCIMRPFGTKYGAEIMQSFSTFTEAYNALEGYE